MQNVSRETSQMLDDYAALFRRWSKRINLASPHDLDQLENRHLKDCQQVQKLTNPPAKWVDIGSGGGLPGAVVAICLSKMPTQVILIESDQRKSAFLKNVRRELGLPNMHILTDRIESAKPQSAEIVSARALAPLPKLLGYVQRHLAGDGKALLMKGANWQAEVEEAQKMWHFTCQATASITDPNAAILQITDIRHVQS